MQSEKPARLKLGGLSRAAVTTGAQCGVCFLRCDKDYGNLSRPITRGSLLVVPWWWSSIYRPAASRCSRHDDPTTTHLLPAAGCAARLLLLVTTTLGRRPRMYEYQI